MAPGTETISHPCPPLWSYRHRVFFGRSQYLGVAGFDSDLDFDLISYLISFFVTTQACLVQMCFIVFFFNPLDSSSKEIGWSPGFSSVFFGSSERPCGLLSSFSTAQLGMFEVSRSGLHVTGYLGGGFKDFFFIPKIGEDEPNLTIIFFRWV